MDSFSSNTPGLPILLAYGFLILIYLVILRLLLNLLQQMSNKHRIQRSVIDSDIHQTMSSNLDGSMQTFDAYPIAIVIAKGGIAAISMAAVIVLMVIKVGIVATASLVVIVVLFAWAVNHWLRSREKVGTIRQITKVVEKSGSIATVVMLSIVLVVLLFLMIVLQ